MGSREVHEIHRDIIKNKSTHVWGEASRSSVDLPSLSPTEVRDPLHETPHSEV